MSWPQATQYSAVIQAPAACFSDPELQQARPEVDTLFGLPLTFSGNFANVYKLVGADQAWAVKCFTRPAPDRQSRYQRISRHLEEHRKRFVVEHRFLDEGIRVDGAWFPVVKMRWVEGHALNDFLRDHAGNAALLEQLAGLWLRLAAGMREINLAHGDLQHGNVLLVPGKTADAMVLRLIDYDGLWVPDAADLPPGEVGHANYQHPQRLREGGYGPEIDRFAHLVIYTAVRALAVGGKALWEKFDNGENLLFREADFRAPQQSRLLPALLALPDASVQTLVAHLLCASQGPLEEVPLLADLLSGGLVAPLSRDQIECMGRLVPPTRRAAPAPAAVPALPGPLLEPPAEAVPEADPVAPPPPIPVILRPGGGVAVLEREPAVQTVPPPLPLVAGRRARPALYSPAPEWLLRLGLAPDGALARLWPVALGCALGLPLLALLAWLALPPSPGEPPPPAVPPPRLLGVPALNLHAGRPARLRVQIDRAAGRGPLRLVVTDLPTAARSVEVTVPTGAGVVTVEVPVTVPLDSPALTRSVTVTLVGPGGTVDEQQAVLRVEPFLRPRFTRLEPIRLIAGGTVEVAPAIRANGSHGPWELRFSGLPPSVRAVLRRSPQPAATAVLSADDSAAETAKVVTVDLFAEGLVADTMNVPLSVERPGAVRVDVRAAESVTVKAGGKAALEVKLTRHRHDGAIRLQVLDLPEGVTASPVVVENGSTARVVLHAHEGAAVPLLRQRPRLVALVADKEVGSHSFWLELARDSPLPPTPPPAVVKVAPAKEVQFFSADGVPLKGTLYPADKPREAPCVLMVHDLRPGSHRNDAGWRKLALGLQRLGFTVLTFDLRGFGESRADKDLPAAFWAIGPNARMLKEVGAARFKNGLDRAHFPSWYVPFLVQDLVAARALLDQKHDVLELNTRNLLLVAAGEGAQLASVWLAGECRRSKVPLAVEKKSHPPESRDLMGAVWIDCAPRLAKQMLPRGKNGGTQGILSAEKNWPPMLFLHERDNKAAAETARGRAKVFGQPAAAVVGLEGDKLAGMGLLSSKEGEKWVLEMAGVWRKKHTMREWESRGLRFSGYRWTIRAKEPVVAWAPFAFGTSLGLLPLTELGFPNLKVP